MVKIVFFILCNSTLSIVKPSQGLKYIEERKHHLESFYPEPEKIIKMLNFIGLYI